MRLEPLDDSVRLHLSPTEYELLLDCAPNKQCYFATRIEAECSPRIGRVAKLKRGSFGIPDEPKVDIPFLRLRGTKDTTEGENPIGGKARMSWVPRDLYTELMEWADQNSISDDEELFDVGKRRLQDYVQVMRENAATRSNNDDYRYFKSHDGRVYYATNMVRRLGVDIELVMEMGGWNSKKAIEPYLRKAQPREMQDELVRSGAVRRDDLPAPPRRKEFEALYEELQRLKELQKFDAVEPLNNLTAGRIAELREIALSQRIENEDGEIEKTNLSQFGEGDRVHSSTPAVAALHLGAQGGEALQGRARREKRAMADNPEMADPTASHAATVVGMCLVPTLALVAAIAIGDGPTAAAGMLLGAGYGTYDIDL